MRAPAFHDTLVKILMVIFFTFFIILCRFTHISFQALNFLFFIPSLYGNSSGPESAEW